jgi:drug/metabolite transporter (DMT)-like permease
VTPLALLLVLVAAFAHAGWNALSKRVPGGAAFVWANELVATVCMVPVAAAGIWLDDGAHVSPAIVGLGVVSGCLHAVYFVLLQRGYASGDLSLVYPLARGTGPVFATAGAIAILGERPGPIAIAGTAAIASGVVLLLATRGLQRGPALAYAVLTGLLIGVYTIWDGHAVRASHAEPLFFLLITNLTIVVALSPAAARERPTLRLLARDHRRAVVAVGLLSPLAYALVLFATRLAGVAYVAPAREVWVTTPRDGTLTILDASAPGKLTVKTTIKLEGSPEGYAVDEARGIFYTNLEDKDRTLAIDVKSRAVKATWSPGCGEDGPRGLAIDTEQGLLVVACTDHLVVLDTAKDGAVRSHLSTGAGVDNIAYLASKRQVYAAAGQAATLTVARLGKDGSLTTLASGPTAEGARVVVADDRGGAYVADSRGGRILYFPAL